MVGIIEVNNQYQKMRTKQTSQNLFFSKISLSQSKDKIPPLIQHSRPRPLEQNEQNLPPPLVKSLDHSLIDSEYIFESRPSTPHAFRKIQSHSLRESELSHSGTHSVQIPIIMEEKMEVQPTNRQSSSPFIKVEENMDRNQSSHAEDDIVGQLGYEPLWFEDKNPPEIEATLLTKPNQLHLYLKHLLEQEIKYHDDPSIRATLSLLSCLLIKLHKYYSRNKKAPSIARSSSEMNINLFPEESKGNLHQQAKIKHLKQQIAEKDNMLISIRNQYDKVITNYAETILNLEPPINEYPQKRRYSKKQLKILRQETFGLMPYQNDSHDQFYF